MHADSDKMQNDRVLGNILLTKVDLNAARYLAAGSNGDTTLEGAVYDLYAADTIEHPDGVSGVVDYSKTTDANGQPIWHTTVLTNGGWDTDYLPILQKDRLVASAQINDGKLAFANLYMGRYYLVERATGLVLPIDGNGKLYVTGKYPQLNKKLERTGKYSSLATNSLVKSSARGEYQLAEHDSFKINAKSSLWHWKSRDIGGKSALNYLIYVEGVPFVEAVRLLCEESPGYVPTPHEQVERKRPSFRLPPIAENCDRITRYLLGRGISNAVIQYCIERKILYESAEYHNCVFLGKNAQGVPKYAALRGIYDYGKPFKREAPGSNKAYGFCISPRKDSSTVAVFEAAIDAMAEMTLCGSMANKWRLSLGGISASEKEPPALQEFLQQHPEIRTIELRLDNDSPGRMASAHIQKIYADHYQMLDLPPCLEGGDYADVAKNNLMARTAAHRAAACR